MRLQVLGRRVHYWLAIAVAAPALVIVATGILLQVKKQVPWVQPPEKRGAGGEHAVSLDQVLAACRAIPEAGVAGWDDVDRVDFRPGKHLLKVTTRSRWEIQMDTATGEVLQVAYRRSDLIESLHDGSFFASWTKLGLFLPAGVTLLVMLVSGLYLFWLPLGVKLRRRQGPLPLRARRGG